MTESHGTKIGTIEQYGDIYDVMKDDSTGEKYLTTYDNETKMKVILRFNQDTSNDGNFAKLALQSVADMYGISIMHKGNIIKPTAK